MRDERTCRGCGTNRGSDHCVYPSKGATLTSDRGVILCAQSVRMERARILRALNGVETFPVYRERPKMRAQLRDQLRRF